MSKGFTISPQRGISLVELMVGIAVSLILLTGVLSVTLRINVSSGEVVKTARLNQQLRGTLDLMSKEIQRAGYLAWDGANAWAPDVDGNYVDSNIDGNVDILDFYTAAIPEINDIGEVSLFSFATPGNAATAASTCSTNCDCILYSYDIDSDGSVNTGQFELFGFRFNDGAVEMRTAGNGHSCTTGTWQDITDDTVNITRLNFTRVWVNDATAGDSTVYPFTDGKTSAGLATACVAGAGDINDAKCLWRRKIQVNLEGELSGDATVFARLRTDVKIRNDHFNTAP